MHSPMIHVKHVVNRVSARALPVATIGGWRICAFKLCDGQQILQSIDFAKQLRYIFTSVSDEVCVARVNATQVDVVALRSDKTISSKMVPALYKSGPRARRRVLTSALNLSQFCLGQRIRSVSHRWNPNLVRGSGSAIVEVKSCRLRCAHNPPYALALDEIR
jgi:hypothetical protein